MERLVIDKLEGVNLNAVEGVMNAPEEVRSLTFDRAGGLIACGGVNQNWLGHRGFDPLLLEDGDGLLLEDGGAVLSDWQPSANLGTASWMAYDESSMALLGGGLLWDGNSLITLAQEPLLTAKAALVPRGGVISPWEYDGAVYRGAAFYRNVEGGFQAAASAGTATVVKFGAASGFASGTYSFLWIVEVPTDAGLIVHAVGLAEYNTNGATEGIRITLDDAYPVGSLIRLYYHPPSEGYYERFAVLVSDGSTLATFDLLYSDVGSTFVPTDEALVNFAGGRAEVHNGRVWGKGARIPFTYPQSDQKITRVPGGYMLVSGGTFFTERQRGTVAQAQHTVRAAGDYVEIDIERLSVRRTSTTSPIAVELWNSRKTGDANQNMWAYLVWNPGFLTPNLCWMFSTQPATPYGIPDPTNSYAMLGTPPGLGVSVPLAGLHLGTALNSTLVAQNVKVKTTLVSASGSPVVWSTKSEVSVGTATFTHEGTRTAAGATVTAHWTAWATAAATTLALGRVPSEYPPLGFLTSGSFTFFYLAVQGNREIRVRRLQSGNGVTVKALGSIEDYTSGTTWTSSSPQAEDWETNTAANVFVEFAEEPVDASVNPITNPNLTLVYSETGSVNRGKISNFQPLSPLSSTQITALASTPAGLLVFMEAETFLVRGDPGTGDLNIQRLSGTLGCDLGVIPARLGSVVMPIYKGDLYAVNLGGGDVDFGGSVVNVSDPVSVPGDPFVQAIGDPTRNEVVAMTSSGRVFALDIDSQKWRTLAMDGRGVRYILPPTASFGTVYNVNGYLEVMDDALLDTPVLAWHALDAGDKNVMKLWRRVEMFTEGIGDGAPTLTYTARGVSETVDGYEQGEGRWVFTFKRGVVSPTLGMQFKFLGATRDLVIEPPVVVEYVPRYRQR